MKEINLPVSLTIPEMNDTVNDTAHTGLESGLSDPGLSCGFVDPGFTCGLLCFAVNWYPRSRALMPEGWMPTS